MVETKEVNELLKERHEKGEIVLQIVVSIAQLAKHSNPNGPIRLFLFISYTIALSPS